MRTVLSCACAAVLVLGCGGSGTTAADARSDAPTNTDAGDDAAPARLVTEIEVLESELRVGSGPGGVWGPGLELRTSFVNPDLVGPPVLETEGCRVFDLNRTQYEASRGVDAGSVQINASDGFPLIPPCSFEPGLGYWCPDLTTASTGQNASIQPSPGGRFNFVDSDVTYNIESSARILYIFGAANPSNNGRFQIELSTGGHQLICLDSQGTVPETLPASAQHVVVAGGGAFLGVSAGYFVSDDESLAFSFVGADSGVWPSFTATLSDVADRFTLTAGSQDQLFSLPLDGSAVTFECASEAGCGGSAHTMIRIETTDASLDATTDPRALPEPVAQRVVIECQTNGSAVTMPEAVSAYLRDTPFTRAKVSFARYSTAVSSLEPDFADRMAIRGGHSQYGYFDRP